MKTDAINRVTKALRDRLVAALAPPPPQLPNSGDVFIGPLDDANATGAKLILFLYRVLPNPTLRNHEHRIPSTDPAQPAIVYQNALPLDLYFLLTVGTNPTGSEEVLLSGLGIAMQALQLAPELGGATLDYEDVRVSLEPLTTDEMSRIWSLFPTANYRTSVAYVASPVWIDPPLPQAPAPPVTQDSLRAGSLLQGGSR
jgi:hypothetical protein